jgi:hypothetical protein
MQVRYKTFSQISSGLHAMASRLILDYRHCSLLPAKVCKQSPILRTSSSANTGLRSLLVRHCANGIASLSQKSLPCSLLSGKGTQPCSFLRRSRQPCTSLTYQDHRSLQGRFPHRQLNVSTYHSKATSVSSSVNETLTATSEQQLSEAMPKASDQSKATSVSSSVNETLTATSEQQLSEAMPKASDQSKATSVSSSANRTQIATSEPQLSEAMPKASAQRTNRPSSSKDQLQRPRSEKEVFEFVKKFVNECVQRRTVLPKIVDALKAAGFTVERGSVPKLLRKHPETFEYNQANQFVRLRRERDLQVRGEHQLSYKLHPDRLCWKGLQKSHLQCSAPGCSDRSLDAISAGDKKEALTFDLTCR